MDKVNPIRPFWSWNDKLEKDELMMQIESMKSNGIGGFFMHARGGLLTEYLSDEWFELTKLCIEKAEKLGMEAWAYDENGWPSGFANGIVPKMGEEYQQKWLECIKYENGNAVPENIIGVFREENGIYKLCDDLGIGDYIVYYGVNRYYTDVFNKEAIKCFIDNTHEKYYSKLSKYFGGSLKGFFTDEPQYGNGGKLPWSNLFYSEFESRYGYSVKENMIKLFFNADGYESFRNDYYNMVSDLFKTSFLKQMYDWCSEHNCKLTGHIMNEESLERQMFSTAGAMSCYEYFHQPGIDWLFREITNPILPKQLSSVATQLGKKTLTETFALSGWDVSLNELKLIAQWQLVNGVTSLCSHLESYSIRGYRKRDYPPSLFCQLPWFDKAYKYFNEYFSKLGFILDSLQDYAPLLLIHPIQSAYVHYNPLDMRNISRLSNDFINTANTLNGLHIPHHYGDEIIMSKYAKIQRDSLIVGNCTYKYVLLSHIDNITRSTFMLLSQFAANGGKVFVIGDLPRFIDGRKSADITILSKYFCFVDGISELKSELKKSVNIPDIISNNQNNEHINCSIRVNESGETFYYLTNLSENKYTVKFGIKGEYSFVISDVATEKETLQKSYYESGNSLTNLTFDKYGSFLIKATEHKTDYIKPDFKQYIPLSSDFSVESMTDNCLTLDYCEYKIDNGDWQSKMPIILLQQKLLSLKHCCNIQLRFKFFVKEKLKSHISLCTETPEKFSFCINGRNFVFSENGYYIDKSIKKCDISEYIIKGENQIILSGLFYQNSEIYNILFDEGMHESEKNKITYDTELESIYLIGDFGVESDSVYRLGERRCIFSGRDFYITNRKKEVNAENITVQGYYFFSGVMDLSQNIILNKQFNKKYIIKLEDLYCPAAELYINGKKAGLFAFSPFEIDVTEFLHDGENKVKIRLFTGNRNVFGPHHRPYGESYRVCPTTFTDAVEEVDGNNPTWTDNYSFVLFGLKI